MASHAILYRTDAGRTAAVEEILITDQLSSRPRRLPDHALEARALHELGALMGELPGSLYQRFVDLAIELCDAGSAGISVLEATESGEAIFRWTALAGAFAPFVGGHTPRDFSPCGICLDQGQTILLSRPARRFPYLGEVAAPITEGLIVPLYSKGRKPLGTIWIVSHTTEKRFDGEDARVMEALAAFLSVALEKSALLRERELLLAELRHRSKNTLQMITSLLSLQRHRTSDPAGRRALENALARTRTIARVHADLFENGPAPADLAMTIDEMCESLVALAADRRISFEIDVETIVTDPAKLLLVLLIINELITNAVKYAFPDRSDGRIEVRAHRTAPDQLMVQVCDDGVPFEGSPEALKAKGSGFGLVEAFAMQLDGRVIYPAGADKTIKVIMRL
jgi:two-component sensor histidine kinase